MARRRKHSKKLSKHAIAKKMKVLLRKLTK